MKRKLDLLDIPLWLGVFSGNGIHLHFKFKNPIHMGSKNQYQEIYDSIVGYLSCQIDGVIFDPACKNPSRLMRLPFSTNWKDVNNPIPCRVLYHNPEGYFDDVYAKFRMALVNIVEATKENRSDRKLILSKLNLVKILEYFEYPKMGSIKEKGAQIICSSPFNPDETPSFYCDLEKKLFYDFSLSKGGDYFSLIALFSQIDSKSNFPELLKIARKIAGVALETPKAHESSQFLIDDNGVWFYPSIESEREWISSPIHIEAMTRDENNKSWGRLLTFKDQDGFEKSWSMPMDLLAGDGIEVRRQLLNLGMQVALGKRERGLLLSYLQSTKPSKRIQCVERMGWHGVNFVLPKETIRKEEQGLGQSVVLQGQFGKDEVYTSGTLQDWQDNVGKYCVGNSRLILAVCTALASVLVRGSGLENGGFHFVGPSSIGKSIALKVAASIWGNPGINGFIKRWRSTLNGLELLAVSRCDGLLILDELGEIQPNDAGLAAYILGSGQSKARSTQNRTLVEQQEWRLLFLSSGEIGLSSHINSEGKQSKTGQEIRLIDINANPDKGFGLFEDIHNFSIPNEFATQLSQNAETFFGSPIVSFLKSIINASNLSSKIAKKRKQFIESLELENKHSQIFRVAQRFSLLSAAGELAIEMGILPWTAGDAIGGCIRCFKDWQIHWGCSGNKEGQQILQQIRKIIQEFGPSKFPLLQEKKNFSANHVGVLWGFRNIKHNGDIEWLILSEIFKKEFCKGFELRSVLKTLKDSELITLNGDEAFYSFRLPHLGMTRIVKIKSELIL